MTRTRAESDDLALKDTVAAEIASGIVQAWFETALGSPSDRVYTVGRSENDELLSGNLEVENEVRLRPVPQLTALNVATRTLTPPSRRSSHSHREPGVVDCKQLPPLQPRPFVPSVSSRSSPRKERREAPVPELVSTTLPVEFLEPCSKPSKSPVAGNRHVADPFVGNAHRMGTQQVLQEALHDAVKSPALPPARNLYYGPNVGNSYTPSFPSSTRSSRPPPVRIGGWLPPIGDPRPSQDADQAVDISIASPEPKVFIRPKGKPLYLRMQEHFQEQEDLKFRCAQERHLAGLMIQAVPAHIVSPRRPKPKRRQVSVKKKVVRPKKKTCEPSGQGGVQNVLRPSNGISHSSEVPSEKPAEHTVERRKPKSQTPKKTKPSNEASVSTAPDVTQVVRVK